MSGTSTIIWGNSSDVHNATLSKNNNFEVFLNFDIAGPQWIVIQQRIRGGVDFQKSWAEYKQGFGDFWDGDFFLGLDKIHRLTTGLPHELYIHLEQFNGITNFARYSEFVISGEDDGYRLSKLGNFTGNTTDAMEYGRGYKFTTYDRDNDLMNTNCAEEYSPWWYNTCDGA